MQDLRRRKHCCRHLVVSCVNISILEYAMVEICRNGRCVVIAMWLNEFY